MEPITIYAYPVTKSPFSLAECQEKLSPERLEQLSKFPEQSRQHSLAGDLLAMTAYRKAYPGDLFPPERAVTPAGKPYFPARPEFHYSISHANLNKIWLKFSAFHIYFRISPLKFNCLVFLYSLSSSPNLLIDLPD